MSYSIIRVAKVKSNTNTTGLQKHIQRENKNYENMDIDLEQSHLNYDLVNDNPIDYNATINKKIEENYTGKRKIRTDAVKHVDGLITSDNEFFNNQTPEDTKQFFEHAKSFLEEKYGKDNLLYATVHMDEKTPHMHYGVVPITTDGRLSAKEIVGNKKALTEFQDRFNEYVKQQGYERGQSRQVTNEKHEQMSEYKRKTEYHKQEYELESQKLDHIRQNNDKLMREYQKSLETLKTPINVPYEQETEKVGGLFSKEVKETGNVVISKEDFHDFQKQIEAAQSISNDYEYIKSDKALNDLRNENTKLKEDNERAFESLSKITDVAKERRSQLEKADKLVKIIQEIFEKLEQVIGRKTYKDLMNDVTRENSDMINMVRTLEKQIHPEEHQEKEQKRNRGISR